MSYARLTALSGWYRGLSSILVVEKPGAVVDLLLLLGPSLPSLARQIAPNSLRAKLGQDAVKNGVYASPSAPQSIVDIELMFPNPFPCVRTLGIVQPEAFRTSSNPRAAWLLFSQCKIV